MLGNECLSLFFINLLPEWKPTWLSDACQMTNLSKSLSIPPCTHMSLLLFPFHPSIVSNNNVTVRRFYKLFYSIPNAPQITQKYLNIEVFNKKILGLFGHWYYGCPRVRLTELWFLASCPHAASDCFFPRMFSSKRKRFLNASRISLRVSVCLCICLLALMKHCNLYWSTTDASICPPGLVFQKPEVSFTIL